jgi:hypothetical protein
MYLRRLSSNVGVKATVRSNLSGAGGVPLPPPVVAHPARVRVIVNKVEAIAAHAMTVIPVNVPVFIFMFCSFAKAGHFLAFGWFCQVFWRKLTPDEQLIPYNTISS